MIAAAAQRMIHERADIQQLGSPVGQSSSKSFVDEAYGQPQMFKMKRFANV
jgi:hypothetical protein